MIEQGKAHNDRWGPFWVAGGIVATLLLMGCLLWVFAPPGGSVAYGGEAGDVVTIKTNDLTSMKAAWRRRGFVFWPNAPMSHLEILQTKRECGQLFQAEFGMSPLIEAVIFGKMVGADPVKLCVAKQRPAKDYAKWLCEMEGKVLLAFYPGEFEVACIRKSGKVA